MVYLHNTLFSFKVINSISVLSFNDGVDGMYHSIIYDKEYLRMYCNRNQIFLQPRQKQNHSI